MVDGQGIVEIGALEGLALEQSPDALEGSSRAGAIPGLALSFVLLGHSRKEMLQGDGAQTKECLDVVAVALFEDEVVEQGGAGDVSAEDGVEANPVAGG